MQPRRSTSRRKNNHEEHGSPHMAHDESNWLVSYADMMTLLFGFFVLMYAFSKVDEDKFEVVRKDLVKYFGGTLKENPGASNLKKVLDAEISKMMGEGGFKDQVKIKIKDNYIQMNFESQILFNPGSAELTPLSAKVIDKVATEVKKLPVEQIEVEGHTDIDAIQSAYFPSNWELSTARSSRIVRRFIENKMDEKWFTAVGYGSSRPNAPHLDPSGNAILENKTKNRRVVVNIRLKPDGNLSLEEMNKIGFRTVSSETPESQEAKEEIKKSNDKLAEVKKKIEEAQQRYKEMNEKLKAAKELEKSVKEMDKIVKKTEELERKVQSVESQTKELKKIDGGQVEKK